MQKVNFPGQKALISALTVMMVMSTHALRPSPTFLAAAPEPVSQNITHVQTLLIMHV